MEVRTPDSSQNTRWHPSISSLVLHALPTFMSVNEKSLSREPTYGDDFDMKRHLTIQKNYFPSHGRPPNVRAGTDSPRRGPEVGFEEVWNIIPSGWARLMEPFGALRSEVREVK